MRMHHCVRSNYLHYPFHSFLHIDCTSLPFLWRNSPTRARAASFLRFLDHTHWHITEGRTPLDEWSARRRDLYVTTHNTHNRQTFEPAIPASDRPQIVATVRPYCTLNLVWATEESKSWRSFDERNVVRHQSFSEAVTTPINHRSFYVTQKY